MSQEQAIINDFEDRTRESWASLADYDTVTALLLYWEEDDLNVKPEVIRLECLLSDDFGFSTSTVLIPSKSPKAELQYQLAAFVKENSLAKKSLSIVYYAGHADNSNEITPAGYSEWRAREQGGPSVNWFEIQPSLYAAEGDVLILLDCCHAALKTRGTKKGKMEVLAASASGSLVPEPGRLSFTSVLIRQIRKQLQVRKDISIRWLHRHLWDDTTYPGLTETPVYFDLSENDERSIILRPLLAKPPDGFARRKATPSAFMMLTVSLADDPTGLQIANWLRSFPPSIVQDVEIEGLVLKARRLEGLQNIKTLFTGSILGRLSQSAQLEITERLSVLSGVVCSAAAFATTAAIEPKRINTDANSGCAERVINELETNVSAVCDTIEDSLLLDTNLELKTAAEDELVVAVGATQAISLRQYLLDSSRIPDQPDIPREAIKFGLGSRPGAKNRFRIGSIAGNPVIVETFQYEMPPGESSEPPRNFAQQVRKMVTQLSQPKRTNFHILPCIGYFQDRYATQFSVVFQLEDRFVKDNPTTLSSLYSSMKRVSLGERVRLAYEIAVAVGNLHRVGWLHKELKSENILFFKILPRGEVDESTDPVAKSSPSINFGLPCLFGFEYSRQEDANTYLEPDYSLESNAYRHPERWGKPRVKFERSHDVYSLGILMLEIGLWKQIQQFPELKKPRIDPWTVKEDLLIKNKRDLPHMVGQNFSGAIDACFRFKELTTGLNEFEAQRMLREKIIEKLQKAVHNI